MPPSPNDEIHFFPNRHLPTTTIRRNPDNNENSFNFHPPNNGRCCSVGPFVVPNGIAFHGLR